MQVVIYKDFLLNPEKNLAQIRLVAFEKNVKKRTLLITKNDVTELNSRSSRVNRFFCCKNKQNYSDTLQLSILLAGSCEMT